MIITRAPLRITLGGGGTDVPSYYREHGGFCVAMAIDKYVYITLHETFEPGITLKYSKMEHVKSVDEIEHPIFREAFRMMNLRDPHLEIASHADIPAGTGLGSSSSFTVALLAALFAYKEMDVPVRTLARYACELEIDTLGGPIGKQDQYAAALGGLIGLTFCADDTVDIAIFPKTRTQFWADNLMLFFMGYPARSASSILATQNNDNLNAIKDAGYHAWQMLSRSGDDLFGLLGEELNTQWRLKCERDTLTPTQIIEWHKLGLDNGAFGGKMVGAGGGGFLLFQPQDPQKLRTEMHKAGLKEVRFNADLDGAKII